jgi:hypothetical protein
MGCDDCDDYFWRYSWCFVIFIFYTIICRKHSALEIPRRKLASTQALTRTSPTPQWNGTLAWVLRLGGSYDWNGKAECRQTVPYKKVGRLSHINSPIRAKLSANFFFGSLSWTFAKAKERGARDPGWGCLPAGDPSQKLPQATGIDSTTTLP